jgi:hypothetical protein
MKLTKALAMTAATLTIAGSACGPFNLGARERAAVIFTNETTDQADVYATISGSDAVRIGSVFSLKTDTLMVPSSVTDRSAQINIVARVFARNVQPSTGLVTLRAGDMIRVRLTSDGRMLAVTP